MRIQHNIPAMSAYRNYTNNTSALSKNLEKLSSGYKINRAGDDAAGLAISEKMRAQITGLEVAQKNAKDGISLIQTAEGALTEVHSMLNRMYELAEQSANGTYDDDVDRTQLQKEVDQLRTEINRISQASNFNGIKLLDGSMNAGDVVTTVVGKDNIEIPITDGDGKPIGDVGSKTILKTAPTTEKQTQFTINLQNAHIQNAQAGDKLKMTFGDVSLELTVDATGTAENTITATDAADATKVAQKFAKLFASENNGGAKGTFKGQAFTATENGYEIDFLQTNMPKSESDVVNADWNVKIEYTKATPPGGGGRSTDPVVSITEAKNATVGATAGVKKYLQLNADGVTVENAKGDFTTATQTEQTVEVRLSYNSGKVGVALSGLTGVTVKQVDLTGDDGTKTGDATGVMYDEKATGDSNALKNGKLTITLSDDTKITINADFGTWSYPTDTPNTISFKVKTTPAGGGGEGGGGNTTPATGLGAGSYNVSTTKNVQGAITAAGQLASTKIKLTEEFAKDGGKLTIGNSTYVFKVGDQSMVKAGHGETLIEIKDADLARYKGDASNVETVIDAIGEKLSMPDIATNSAFVLGYDQTANELSIHEKQNQTDFTDQLKTHAEFQKLIHGASQDTTITTKGNGNSLVLQIGDTSEDFNKLVVNVKACNADAMGIGTIDISTQDGASAAMTAIKNAINYVSDVRGDLGATQNRLDHTINNLSVMQENIQDAESTIRDVDVAKEMMEYTKNNILVQSAQAMLAQANQLPQGVLQLLQ